ncbi:RNA polymerase sigma factor [Spirosoma sp. KUDC1026]|uniref:RNA polymerase sigma factor n=1 Tax=Spirosoma sp. KUDC1026 TaxID=2745947 RepID=UPI00159BDFF5|nr:RNA polymerase sigma factor [Spirosoma sp. KUDC1026]QKZ13292.1 RNA polymerase sigma factor [Spirosoma sp. KUDC1026]
MTESELLIELKAGSEAAFRRFVETYQTRVFNLAFRLLGDRDEADDVAQEVFAEVYETIGQFRGEATFSTWLYRITTTQSLSHLRKKRTRKRFAFVTSLFGASNELLHDPPDTSQPEQALAQTEENQLLLRAVGQLPDTQRAAFTLHYMEGLSYKEVAAILQTTVSAVESLLHRAKRQLRTKLQPYYADVFNGN